MSHAAPGAASGSRPRIVWNGWGFVGALIMFWQAMTPTLVPRNWWMNAVVIGVSMAFGYAVGSLLRAGWRWARPRLGVTVTMTEPQRTWARRIAIGLLVGITLVAAVAGHLAQDQVADLLGAAQRGPAAFIVGVICGSALFGLLVLAGKGIAALRRWLRGHAARFAPDLVASVLATLAIVFVILMLTDSVLFRGLMEPAMEKATQDAAKSPDGRSAPSIPERSGSPASGESWDSLGYEGKIIVTSGPTPERIAAVTSRPAKQPIRVYAGKSAHQDVADAARAVVAELKRTGAFDRKHLLVTTTTGTGWVPEWSLSSFEMLGGGDTAIASMQYSFFPSPLAYVSSREVPVEAGRALLGAVRDHLATLPPDRRPKLYASGESLGSYGGQGAFATPEQMAEQVDGAVWSGTPPFSPVWERLTAQRQLGTPQIAPVIDGGRTVRFVTRREDLSRTYFGGRYDPWGERRIVYLQHPSDAIVWWSPQMLLAEPDWMREKVGRDVADRVRWYPWVSFWQLAADMPVATAVPPETGHRYLESFVPTWAAVLHVEDAELVERVLVELRHSIDKN